MKVAIYQAHALSSTQLNNLNISLFFKLSFINCLLSSSWLESYIWSYICLYLVLTWVIPDPFLDLQLSSVGTCFALSVVLIYTTCSSLEDACAQVMSFNSKPSFQTYFLIKESRVYNSPHPHTY